MQRRQRIRRGDRHRNAPPLLRGLFDAYYADKADKPVVFDTNRQWSSRLPAISDLFPKAKVIACVRNVAWVMDSLERLYRANPYENTKLFGDAVERNTVYSRCETLASAIVWSVLPGRHSRKPITASTPIRC
jgi:hypothetical protein